VPPSLPSRYAARHSHPAPARLLAASPFGLRKPTWAEVPQEAGVFLLRDEKPSASSFDPGRRDVLNRKFAE